MLVELSQPLGLRLDESLNVVEVLAQSQAERLEVRPGWRVITIGGSEMQRGTSSERLATALSDRRALGRRSARVTFEVPDLVVTLSERPPMKYRADLRTFVLEEGISGEARSNGLQPGMALSRVGDKDVIGVNRETVEKLFAANADLGFAELQASAAEAGATQAAVELASRRRKTLMVPLRICLLGKESGPRNASVCELIVEGTGDNDVLLNVVPLSRRMDELKRVLEL